VEKAISNTYSECVVLALPISYPACTVHASCFFVNCDTCGYSIFFPHYLINGTIFGGKKVLNINCVFRFSIQLIFLTFKNRASYLYIGRSYRYPPDVAFYIFFSTNISTEYFKHAAHSPFFSSKYGLFHNATFFGSCIIHIFTYRVC